MKRSKSTQENPQRARRRLSDAKWRASVATCYDALKNVVPNVETLSKRKVSKALILQETEKHIEELESVVKHLLHIESQEVGTSVSWVDGDSIIPCTLEHFQEDFRKKQDKIFQTSASSRRCYSLFQDIKDEVLNIKVDPSQLIFSQDENSVLGNLPRLSSYSSGQDSTETSSQNKSLPNNKKRPTTKMRKRKSSGLFQGEGLKGKCPKLQVEKIFRFKNESLEELVPQKKAYEISVIKGNEISRAPNLPRKVKVRVKPSKMPKLAIKKTESVCQPEIVSFPFQDSIDNFGGLNLDELFNLDVKLETPLQEKDNLNKLGNKKNSDANTCTQTLPLQANVHQRFRPSLIKDTFLSSVCDLWDSPDQIELTTSSDLSTPLFDRWSGNTRSSTARKKLNFNIPKNSGTPQTISRFLTPERSSKPQATVSTGFTPIKLPLSEDLSNSLDVLSPWNHTDFSRSVPQGYEVNDNLLCLETMDFLDLDDSWHGEDTPLTCPSKTDSRAGMHKQKTSEGKIREEKDHSGCRRSLEKLYDAPYQTTRCENSQIVPELDLQETQNVINQIDEEFATQVALINNPDFHESNKIENLPDNLEDVFKENGSNLSLQSESKTKCEDGQVVPELKSHGKDSSSHKDEQYTTQITFQDHSDFEGFLNYYRQMGKNVTDNVGSTDLHSPTVAARVAHMWSALSKQEKANWSSQTSLNMFTLST